MICPNCETTELQSYNIKRFQIGKQHLRRYCPDCKMAFTSQEVLDEASIHPVKRNPVTISEYKQRSEEGKARNERAIRSSGGADPPAVLKYKRAMSQLHEVRYKENL